MQNDSPTIVQSHEEVEQLADGNVVLQAKYSFFSTLNGPFGTVDVTLTKTRTGEHAFGKVVIQTIFQRGSETTLQYSGTATFNGSTGYTSITAEGKGILSAFPNPPKPIKAKIHIDLAPGFKTGTFSVQGFFTNMPLTATAIQTEG